jgi:hypothetical protein
MSYTRKFPSNPKIIEPIWQFLQANNLKGTIKNETRPQRGSADAEVENKPTGWATLTVETSEPKILTILNLLIWKLEQETGPNPR